MTSSGYASPDACVAVFSSLTTVAFMAVVLRLYTRISLLRNAGLDDCLMVVAMVCSVGLTISQCHQVKYGSGQHQSTLSSNDSESLSKSLYAALILYQLGLHFTKLSISCQYLRIFTSPLFRILCCTLIGFISVWGCVAVIGNVFICTPISFFWDKSGEGQCMSFYALWFTLAGVNILTDFATAALPLPFLTQLPLPYQQKYAVMAVFALGGFVCIISIVRLESLVVFLSTDDIAWNNGMAAIWSCVEMNTGILCSCLPTLRPHIARIFPSLSQSTRRQLSELSSTKAERPSGSCYQEMRISSDEAGQMFGAETSYDLPQRPVNSRLANVKQIEVCGPCDVEAGIRITRHLEEELNEYLWILPETASGMRVVIVRRV